MGGEEGGEEKWGMRGEGRGQPMCILVHPPSNKRLCHQ